MRNKAFAVLFACLMATSMFASVAAGASTAGQAATPTEPITESQSTQDSIEPAPVSPSLQDAEGVREIVVRLTEPDVSATASDAEARATMKEHARTVQQPVLEWARATDGVQVEGTSWIAPMVLLEVDTNEINVGSIAALNPSIERIHPNFEVSVPEPVSPDSQSQSVDDPGTDDYDTTYGLDQINATEVWESYGTMGDGARVAVLDTGIDPDHPDIDLYTEDSSDPTYPGGYVNTSPDGDLLYEEPTVFGDHGTHVSGTVSGGNASGEWIGVAPNVDLLHGSVLTDCSVLGCGGTFAQIVAGMEWAVDQDADVISMSLGAAGFYSEMIDPVRNAHDAGTIVVAASGNDGSGTSGSPANVYDAVAIGASNSDAGIASFSSGEEVDTSADWGNDAPSEWPANFVVPDVSAPGVNVKSSVPGGGYDDTYSGTSMATPHVAGTVALMLSAAGGDLPVSTIKSALYDTAWKPSDCQPSCNPRNGNDTRYGTGIMDALEATNTVALEQGIEGTVTDDSDAPVADATVSTDDGFSATTGQDGSYTVLSENGTTEVTADAFGYESSSATVTVPDGSYVTQNFSLTPALDVAPVSGQPDSIATGENVTVTADVAHLETLTVERSGSYDGSADLWINGEAASFGDEFSFDGEYSGEVTVTVSTAEGASGVLSLTHTLSGLGNTTTVETGPTEIFDEYIDVAVVTDDSYGNDVMTALDDQLGAQFTLTVIDSQTAIDAPDAYDAYVVQEIDDANAEAFAQNTSGPLTGVVWLDQWGSSSNGIEARSDALDDPSDIGEGDFEGTPYFNASDHRLFEGVADPGESVDIHSGTFSDHTFFSGTSAEVVGDIGTPDSGIKGAGLAVDGERNAVLAATLGRSTYVGNADFTEEADQILANAVEEVTVHEPQPAGEVVATDVRAQPDAIGTVEVDTTAPDVAGYQLTLEFDPDVVQVDEVHGVDFDDPVVDVDNDAGTISLAQATAQGQDAPTLAEVDFEMVGDRGDVSWVNFTGESNMLTYTNGSSIFVSYDDGQAEIATCEAGDANMDGSVTVTDGVLAMQYIAGLPIDGTFNEACADMNGDGQVTSADVTLILQKALGIGESASVSAPTGAMAGA